jgi:hypothetical protein
MTDNIKITTVIQAVVIVIIFYALLIYGTRHMIPKDWILHNTDNLQSQTKTEVVDGCEYLVNSSGFTHKGNCKNPIHVYAMPKN